MLWGVGISILLRLNNIPCMCISHFVYPFLHQQTLGCFNVLWLYGELHIYAHECANICSSLCFQSFRVYTQKRDRDINGVSIFDLLRDHHVVSHGGGTISHPHRQGTWVPTPPHLHLHLFSVFLTAAILTGVNGMSLWSGFPFP